MKKKIVTLAGWHIVEQVVYKNEVYYRVDSIDDGIVWYPEGCVGDSEYVIQDELEGELEEFYQKSKQGYSHLFKK